MAKAASDLRVAVRLLRQRHLQHLVVIGPRRHDVADLKGAQPEVIRAI